MTEPKADYVPAVVEAEIVPPPATMTPPQTLALAIQKGVDPSVLKQMLELQERWEAGEARKAYVVAMTKFKAEAPAVLAKDAEVDFTSAKGRTHYRHATLGGIIQKITPHLSRHGLSVSWSTDQRPDGSVAVTCHVTHERGHSEQVQLVAPPDNSGNKNSIQQIGSTVSYLQRYTLQSALGLATADQDDDGVSAGPRPGTGRDDDIVDERLPTPARPRPAPSAPKAPPATDDDAAMNAEASKHKCPTCGGPMQLKRRKSDGNPFMSCQRFPECKGIKSWPKDAPATQDDLAPRPDQHAAANSDAGMAAFLAECERTGYRTDVAFSAVMAWWAKEHRDHEYDRNNPADREAALAYIRTWPTCQIHQDFDDHAQRPQ